MSVVHFSGSHVHMYTLRSAFIYLLQCVTIKLCVAGTVE